MSYLKSGIESIKRQLDVPIPSVILSDEQAKAILQALQEKCDKLEAQNKAGET